MLFLWVMQADIILAINEEFETEYDQEAPWHSLFADKLASKVCLHQGMLQSGLLITSPPAERQACVASMFLHRQRGQCPQGFDSWHGMTWDHEAKTACAQR